MNSFENSFQMLRLTAFGVAWLVAAVGVYLGRKRLALAIPVAAIFLLLAAIAIPGWVAGRFYAEQNACINNLRSIQREKEAYARMDTSSTNIHFYLLSGVSSVSNRHWVCPAGGIYKFGELKEDPTCSLFAKGHQLP